MHRSCFDNYKDPRYNASDALGGNRTWSQWGCDGLAETYADAVGTRIGAWAFSLSNKDRCACGCPSGTSNCTDICLKSCAERCELLDCSKDPPLLPPLSSSKVTSTTTTSSSSSTSTTKPTTTSSSIKTSTSLKTTSSTATSGSPAAETSKGSSWWPFGSAKQRVDANDNHESGYTRPEKPETSSSWWPFR
jgi:hypothetical protein